jgi:hypothetical protein
LETIDLLLGAARTAGVIALLFLVPGLALGRLVAPGAMSPLARLGRAAGVSLLTTSVTCTVLALVGLLRPPIVLAALLALTIVPLLLMRPAIPRWPRGRRARWWIGAAIGLAVVAVLVIVPSQQQVGASLLPFTSTVWYYGALSAHLADLGAIPATFPEWGAERAFHTDYLPFTAHAAAFFGLLADDLPMRMEAYRLAVLGAGALVAALLFRRWVSSWLALLGAVLLLATERLGLKMLSFKPETFALVVALFALWALDRAIVERSRRLLALAVAAATLTFLAHAEVFLVLVALAAALGLARLIVAQARTGRPPRRLVEAIGLRRPTLRATGSIALALALLVGGSLVLGTLVNGTIAGEFRLIGYLTDDRGTDPAADGTSDVPPADAPPGWTFTGDPTWDFYVAAVAPGQLGAEPPSSFTDRRLLPRATVHVWPGLDGRLPSLLIVLGALVVTPLVAWPWLDGRRRRLVVTGYAFGVALAIGSYLLFVIADTYVPQRVGPRRLMPYELVVPVVAALVVLWGLDRLLRPGWRTLFADPGARRRSATAIAGGALLVLLTAGMVAPTTQATIEPDEEPELRITPAGAEAWRWIAANTPPDARILTNAYTDGVVVGLGERLGIVDGRAVYLEDPAFLRQSTELLLGARSLFLEPDGEAADAYLARNDIDYLVVADAAAGASGLDLGGYLPFETDVGAIEGSDRYTLVRTFGDGLVRVYEVARR